MGPNVQHSAEVKIYISNHFQLLCIAYKHGVSFCAPNAFNYVHGFLDNYEPSKSTMHRIYLSIQIHLCIYMYAEIWASLVRFYVLLSCSKKTLTKKNPLRWSVEEPSEAEPAG